MFDMLTKKGSEAVLEFLMIVETEKEREMLATIYEENLLYLRRLAMRFFPQDVALAEEAIAEVFVSVAERFQDLREMPKQEWPPYLNVAVKNRCKNILKRESQHAHLEEVQWFVEPKTEDLKEDYALAVKEIYALEEIYREVLECRLVLGWSNKEVATGLGISEETARKRFQRGRTMVAERLMKEGVSFG